LSKAACSHYRDHGSWPELEVLHAADKRLPRRDRWQGDFVLRVEDGAVVISCAGPDQVFETDDDVVTPPVSPN